MKRHLFLILIFILFQEIVLGQNIIKLDTTSTYWEYYKLIQIAEEESINSQFNYADSIYRIAFKKVTRPFKQDYFNAYDNAKKFNNDLALNHLLKGISLGITKKELKKSSYYNSLNNTADKKKCLKELKDIKISRNDSLYKVIKKMVRKDQKARASWTDWLKWDKQVKIMDKVDRLNAKKLLDICQNYGWPGFSSIGENTDSKYGAEDASLLILHFNKKEYQKLLPYMIKAVENGEMYPYNLARFTDYLYMGDVTDSANYKILEIKQIYGTMYYSQNEIIPYGKTEDVNMRRKLIGLGSISLYARRRKLQLPVKEKIRTIHKQ